MRVKLAVLFLSKMRKKQKSYLVTLLGKLMRHEKSVGQASKRLKRLLKSLRALASYVIALKRRLSVWKRRLVN